MKGTFWGDRELVWDLDGRVWDLGDTFLGSRDVLWDVDDRFWIYEVHFWDLGDALLGCGTRFLFIPRWGW